jgi:hypothetical protein
MIESLGALPGRGDEDLQALLQVRLPDIFLESLRPQLRLGYPVVLGG